ncbi:MAG TPA: hypothetical protein VKU90_02070 [Caulobacteraceae bacterium]|nr:hypothetical protein [Caulobacteraceae bacterium]
MRKAFIGLAGLALVAACSKAPANVASSAESAGASATPASAAATPAAAVSGPAVSGTFTVDGKAATLIQVTAHKDDPFDGQPVTALVFTAKDQNGDAKAATNALFGNYGDAIVARVEPDGTVIGADVVHSGLKEQGSVSISGAFTIKAFKSSGGVISGELTTSGPNDVFDQKLDVDLTFHTAAP